MNRNDKAKIRYMIEQKCDELGFPLPDHPYGYTLLTISKWMSNNDFLAFCEWVIGKTVADDPVRGKVIRAFDVLEFVGTRENNVLNPKLED